MSDIKTTTPLQERYDEAIQQIEQDIRSWNDSFGPEDERSRFVTRRHNVTREKLLLIDSTNPPSTENVAAKVDAFDSGHLEHESDLDLRGASPPLSTIIRRLQEALTKIEKCDHAVDQRLPVQLRAVSLQFFEDWMAALEAELSANTMKKMNSFHIVGEKCVETNEWFAESSSTKLPPSLSPPWSIRWLTGKTSLSLVETLMVAAESTGDSSLTHDSHGRAYFGSPTVFLSYTWSSALATTLEAIQAKESTDDNHYYWFDLFCVPQNNFEDASKYKRSDLSDLAEGLPIQESRATWLLAEPWNNPGSFQRVWCLDECFLTAKWGKKLELLMPPVEARLFERALATEVDSLTTVLSSVNIQKARATKDSDRNRIFEKIRTSVGFHRVNTTVIGKLREWFIAVARAILTRTDLQKLPAALVMHNLGLFLLHQGLSGEATAEISQSLTILEDEFGRDHPKTSSVLNNLAAALLSQNRLDEAERFAKRVLSIEGKPPGESNPSSLTTLGHILMEKVR